MPHLRFLYLQDNALAALPPLHGAPALQLLNLSFNALPCARAALLALAPAAASLVELDLAGNLFEAELGCALSERHSLSEFQTTVRQSHTGHHTPRAR